MYIHQSFEMEVKSINNIICAMFSKKPFLALGGLGKNICLYHILIPQISTTWWVSAGMYRVLSNIQNGVASLEFPLLNCG